MADWNCNICKEYKDGLACTYCDDGSEFVRMTNADRIRAMSDEELAEVIECPYGQDRDYCAPKKDCLQCCLEWLQSEAEEPND